MPEYGARSLVEQSYQALDIHLDYWSTIGTLPHRKMTAGFLETYGSPHRKSHWHPDRPGAMGQWTELEHLAWDRAETIVLDPEVHRIVSEAAESMPESPFDVSLLPTRSGVLMMPGLKMLLNYVSPADAALGEDELPTVAIAWNLSPNITVQNEDGGRIEGPGVHLWLYTDAAWRERAARKQEVRLDPSVARIPLHLIDMTPWAGGRTWKGIPQYKSFTADGEPVNEGWDADADGTLLVDPHVAVLRRFMMALWVFMADEIVVPERQHLPRSLRRRAERARPDLSDGMLRIAQLRKMKYLARTEGDEEHEPVQWSHRWWVRGHQRRLASGEIVYVRPHIKGPADKPLVLKNDIVAVRR